MPIFISYSHQNKDFVDALAKQLVMRNVHVWLDRWELNLGDSIVEKVQSAVDGASALLVILSKASVESEWCKKELNAGFLRELEEKRVVVLPVLLEDCDIPVFARGKLYADFRADFDDGLRIVLEGIAKVTNPNLARVKGEDFYTDYSIQWGDLDGLFVLTLTFIEQLKTQPYTCLTRIDIVASPAATKLVNRLAKRASIAHAEHYVMDLLCDHVNARRDIRPRLVDENEKIVHLLVRGAHAAEFYRVRVGARRLGEDTGRDILLNSSNLVRDAHRHMAEVFREPKVPTSRQPARKSQRRQAEGAVPKRRLK